jgi:predicted ATPase
LLFVLEDLHWLDALSQDLLYALAQAIQDLPVLILLAYRPAEPGRPALPRLEKLAYFSRIELASLTLDEATQAISAKLAQLFPERGGELAEPARRVLLNKAQGNPFYIEELLNYLHDQGIDPRAEGALEQIELPDSLHTLVLSRLDQLGEHEKTTLKVASIVGRLFHARWLNGYYPELGGDEQVRGCLRQLQELDITPLDTPEPELTYLFKHVVTQEVTYQSIPQGLRAQLHEQLAGWLEATLPDPLPLDTLVFHYGRSEQRAKQREYLLKAGQAALCASAFSTAAEYFARLVELTPVEDPQYSALAQQLGEAYYRLGDSVAARAALERAQAAAQSDTDRAAALAFLEQYAGQRGRLCRAQTILAAAVPSSGAARPNGPVPGAVCARRRGAGVGNLEQRAALNESPALARAGDVRELFALNRLGVLASQQDLLEETEQLFKEVLQRAVEVGNRERAMGALNNLGTIAADKRQDYATARQYHAQALALAQELGAQHAIMAFLANLAHDEIMLGQQATARQKLHAGLSMSLRLGLARWTVLVVMYFADLAHAQGQAARALALYGLAQRQAAWTSQNQKDMEETLARWALAPATLQAGLAQGAALDWDQTLKELLDENPPLLV